MTLEGSEFKQKAVDLSACLHKILSALEYHGGEPHQVEYGRLLADRLRPLIAAYDRAVFEDRSREAASEILSEINQQVQQAGASASKGEMGFDFGSAMARYYDLHTIFREPGYRGEEL